MSMTINGTSGLVFNDASTQNTAATGFGFKNRIINGAMMIDQRNAGASVTNTTGFTYLVDRWSSIGSSSSKFTSQQNAGSVTPPVGFTNYLGNTSSTATSVGSTDYYFIGQKIEGYNVADLAWGTANAKTVTLSFQVYSSLTGTFGGVIRNSAGNRSYPFSYTISSANTWTSISITIAGDTTGTWLTTNGIGIEINFGLGVGSTYSGTAGSWAGADYRSATGATSVVGTNGATFYITGVQLEKGSTATSFDYRPYGTELNLCYRYFYKIQHDGSTYGTNRYGSAMANTSTQVSGIIQFPVVMRTYPTGTYSAASDWSFAASNTAYAASAITLPTNPYVSEVGMTVSGANANSGGQVRANATSAWLAFSAEL
jgi:hypothetical protein